MNWKEALLVVIMMSECGFLVADGFACVKVDHKSELRGDDVRR